MNRKAIKRLKLLLLRRISGCTVNEALITLRPWPIEAGYWQSGASRKRQQGATA